MEASQVVRADTVEAMEVAASEGATVYTDAWESFVAWERIDIILEITGETRHMESRMHRFRHACSRCGLQFTAVMTCCVAILVCAPWNPVR